MRSRNRKATSTSKESRVVSHALYYTSIKGIEQGHGGPANTNKRSLDGEYIYQQESIIELTAEVALAVDMTDVLRKCKVSRFTGH